MPKNTSIRYRERMSLGDSAEGAGGAIAIFMMSNVAKVMKWLVTTNQKWPRKLMRKVMDKYAPVPGEGPDVDTLDDWSWAMKGQAKGARGTLNLSMEGDGHPGYRTTANMMAEAALILADPNADKPARAGVLTPASALGAGELARFSNAGMRFSEIS